MEDSGESSGSSNIDEETFSGKCPRDNKVFRRRPATAAPSTSLRRHQTRSPLTCGRSHQVSWTQTHLREPTLSPIDADIENWGEFIDNKETFGEEENETGIQCENSPHWEDEMFECTYGVEGYDYAEGSDGSIFDREGGWGESSSSEDENMAMCDIEVLCLERKNNSEHKSQKETISQKENTESEWINIPHKERLLNDNSDPSDDDLTTHSQVYLLSMIEEEDISEKESSFGNADGLDVLEVEESPRRQLINGNKSLIPIAEDNASSLIANEDIMNISNNAGVEVSPSVVGTTEDEDSDGDTWSNLLPFSQLEAVAVGCALQDAVDQLSILAHTTRAAKLAPRVSQKSLQDRLETLDSKQMEEVEESANATSISSEEARVEKIQRDRALLQEALRRQLKACRFLPRGFPLRKHVRDEERLGYVEERLLKNSENATFRAAQLRSRLPEEAQEMRQDLLALRESRAQFQDQARDLRGRAAIGATITERWEKARQQQHSRRLVSTEQNLQKEIALAHRNKKEEDKAHANLLCYLNSAIEKLGGLSQEWQSRYETVTLDWEEKLCVLKVNRHELNKKLRTIRKELARRDRFKREFLTYKEIRDQQIQERLIANNAATRIQAWWRGTMVRKGLGIYRKASKKKKKKKK